MKFKVRRSSGNNGEGPPCEGAKQELRHSKDLKPYQEWVIRIGTLKALMEFIKANSSTEYGNQIVLDFTEGELPGIEIYDTWRE